MGEDDDYDEQEDIREKKRWGSLLYLITVQYWSNDDTWYN